MCHRTSSRRRSLNMFSATKVSALQTYARSVMWALRGAANNSVRSARTSPSTTDPLRHSFQEELPHRNASTVHSRRRSSGFHLHEAPHAVSHVHTALQHSAASSPIRICSAASHAIRICSAGSCPIFTCSAASHVVPIFSAGVIPETA